MSLKNEFAKWFALKSPLSYRQWYGRNLDEKLSDIDEAYKTSFQKSLFDIDFDNIKDEISKIKYNTKNRWDAKDKTFAEYDKAMCSGIPKAIINNYYIEFLKNCDKDDAGDDDINEIDTEEDESVTTFSYVPRGGFFMLEFVRKNFRIAVDCALFFNLIVWVIVGWNLGSVIGRDCSPFRSCSGDGHAFLGIIIGLAVGILIDIVLGGFIATFVEIGENLKIIKNCIRKTHSGLKPREKIAVAVQLDSFTDSRDRKTYKTTKIGSQVWMAENLSYNASGSKCYNNDENNCQKYGRLYDWNTAMKACPSGWHLPSKSEWEILTITVGGKSTEGKKLKATSGWNENGNGTDEFGFSALPGGVGYSDGTFYGVGNYGNWWSASEGNAYNAYYRGMHYSNEYARWHNYGKSNLFSVRCVRD